MKTLLTVLALLLSVALFAQDTLPEMNQKILDYAESKMGNKVGDGVCGTFVASALKAVDKKWQKKVESGALPGWSMYGMEVDSLSVLPGDIVRLKGCLFSDGSKASSHAGIVSSINKDGTIDVLDQNNGDRRGANNSVDIWRMDPKKIVKGRVFFYRYENNITFAKTH